MTAYLLHDKGALTSERVGKTATHNLPTDDIQQAASLMAWVDSNRDFLKSQSGGGLCGAPAHAGNVYHYSLAWKSGEERSWDEMHEVAQSSVEMFGLEEHQWFVVQHKEEDHPHVHVVINLVNSSTGRIFQPENDHYKIDRWAHEYEVSQDDIQCKNRADKYDAWDKDLDAFKDRPQKLDHGDVVTQAFERSDSGKAFVAALEAEGLVLAQGKRRTFVVVDQAGEIHSLAKTIQFDPSITGRGKTRAVNERLGDLKKDALPHAGTLAAKRKHFDREAQEIAQQKALSDAAAKHAKRAEETKRQLEQKERALVRAQRKQERQKREADWRAFVATKVEESRARWRIAAHTAARDLARDELAEVSGFWGRIFKRRTYLERQDQFQNMEKQLAERTERFQADVDAVPSQRRAWIAERRRAARERERASRVEHVERAADLRQEFQAAATTDSSEMTLEERRAARKQAFLEGQARKQDRDPGSGHDLGWE